MRFLVRLALATLAAAGAFASAAGPIAPAHEFVDVRAAKLHVETVGHGSPIRFLHVSIHPAPRRTLA